MISFILNEIQRQLILSKRYFFQTISTYVFLVIVFISFYYGLNTIVGEEGKKDKIDVFIIGFLIFGLATSSYTGITSNISTLMGGSLSFEIYSTKYSFIVVCIVRCLIEILKSALIFLLLLNIHWLITGNYFYVNYSTLFISLALGLPSLMGLGFFVSGLLLIFKKIGVIQSLMFGAIITLITIDTNEFTEAIYLPFSLAANLAKQSLQLSFSTSIIDLLIVSINSVIYFSIGWAVFKLSESYVLTNGSLDHS